MAKRRQKQDRRGRVIENMGLFWRRDMVLWRGNRKLGPAALWGVQAGAKRAGEVDFWKQVGIYALYADYHLTYVGQAGIGDRSCLGRRLKHHTRDDLAGRWNMFSWFGLCRVKANRTLGARFKLARATWGRIANILEGILIEVAEPPMNSQKGRFGKGVHRYLQVPAPDTGDDLASTVAELRKAVLRIEKEVTGQRRSTRK